MREHSTGSLARSAMREHSTGVSQERHASSVSGAVEQGACCSARCGCLGAVGLTDCPRAPLPWALCSGITLSAAARVLIVPLSAVSGSLGS